MKKELILWLLAQGQGMNKNLKKKILIGLGLVGFFLIFSFGLLTYVGIKATSYLVSNIPSPDSVGQLTATAKTHAKGLATSATSAHCLTEIQSHLNLNVWVTRSVPEIATTLMRACLGGSHIKTNETKEGDPDGENYI